MVRLVAKISTLIVAFITIRSDGTYTTDYFESGKRKKFLSRELYSQLHELYGAVGALSSTLKRDTCSSRYKYRIA